MQYVCSIPGVSKTYTYNDHPADPDYPYMLNENGVNYEGTKLTSRGTEPGVPTARCATKCAAGSWTSGVVRSCAIGSPACGAGAM